MGRHPEEDDAYVALFESAPVSIWHEDLSHVKSFLDEICGEGDAGIRARFAANPDLVRECIRRVRVLQVNRLAREFYGAATQQELIGRLAELFDDNSLAVFGEELAALHEGDNRFQAEVTTRTLVGEHRVVQMNVSLLPTPERPWSRVIVAFTDITERKRLEKELIQSQKLESLGRLAGGLAHDLNNALTIINGYSDMLLTEVPREDATHTHLDEIRKAGERAAALIQQLLAFSRKQVLQPRVVNLNSVITDARNVLRTATGEHIRMVLALHQSLPFTRVDPVQFYHVLLNLVLNARDAMPSGGTIEIRTGEVVIEAGSDHSAAVSPGRYVSLTVTDTGMGMDEETQRRVFEPFFTTKDVGKGTGLGLSSAFGIVKQSGGSITAWSRPGRGSVFTVYLPCTDEPEESAITQRAPVGDLRGSGTILVVEDEPEVRSLLTESLRRFGYEVIECSDPAEAMSVFDDHRPSVRVVVTDVVMPGMTGPALVQNLKDRAPDLKVIYISGYAGSPELTPDVLGSQAAYLQKPFGAEALAATVRRLLVAG